MIPYASESFFSEMLWLTCFFPTGMYHVFLMVKDGFFHITNLALTKIETGMSLKLSCPVDLYFY